MSEGRATHGAIKAGLEQSAHLQDIHKSLKESKGAALADKARGGTGHVELTDADIADAEEMLKNMEDDKDTERQAAA